MRRSTMKVKSPATLEDLMKMPKDGYKYKLVDGAIVASPTGMYHSEVGAGISYTLQKFLDQAPLGRIYGSDVGIQLPDGNLGSPDACFVSAGKLPGGKSPVIFGGMVFLSHLEPGRQGGTHEIMAWIEWCGTKIYQDE
jgi:Putative restriction endonuclease